MIPQLPPDEQQVIDTVREFVEREVIPCAVALEHADAYPAELIGQMKEMGIFGLRVPAAYGGVQVSTPCFAAVSEELARGWMSLAGAIGGHSVIADLLVSYGTDEQKERLLPRLATGELRATMALTEPDGGSDLQAMRTVARRRGSVYHVEGTKMWITNARRAGLIGLLCKTDPDAVPGHRGMSVLLVENGPGVQVSRDLPKLGYKGVETCEIAFADCQVPLSALLGGTEGSGFAQMMKGLELGRIQVAARATGVARAAFDASLDYAQHRVAFGKPIWQHESIGNYLADMAAKLESARLLLYAAAGRLDEGGRRDLEAGLAKLHASEVCLELCQLALRIHASNGYSTEYPVERYFRDAPLMVVGEGTNEIQRTLIARQLVARGGLPL